MTPDEAQKFIKETVAAHDVVLFMKGTADFPQCGFSGQTVQILRHFNVKFVDINVLSDGAIREGVKEFAQWPTIPQLYVKGEFIGGADIALEMAQNGELEKLFVEKLRS